MRKTYAFNGIIIGVLFGILVWAKTNSTVAGIGVAIAASVVCFLIIKGIENAISAGVDRASDAITRKMDESHRNSMSNSSRNGQH